MGNCTSLCIIGSPACRRRCGRRPSRRNRRFDEMGAYDDHGVAHEGIKTLGTNHEDCQFSAADDSALCVCVVTWNMNGKVSSDDLAELVARDRRFDLLAVGLQEVPRCNVLQLLQEALIQTHSFLGESAMQSLRLFVFGPKYLDTYIKELKVDKHAVGGCGGFIGRKKGAVAIYINFRGIRLVFIACHLSAHARNAEERNWQCRQISHSLFAKDWNPFESPPSHLTIWLGDLNYRIQGIHAVPARTLIQNNLHNLLTSNDQLLKEAERGQVFNGYCEGTLSFKPTYKYSVGTSNYDTSYKIRVPSWTDRILFKINDNSRLEAVLHSYESIDGILGSDHKPVRAHLCLKENK